MAISGGTLSTVAIREAESADVQAITSLSRSGGRAAVSEYATRRLEGASVCLVATIDETVVGYVALDYSFYGNGFIPVLFVAETSRRSGVGTSLMRAVERKCKTPKLFTSTNRSNIPMRSLLAGIGFEPSGIIDNLDEGDPEVVYFRAIGASATLMS